MGPDKKGFLYPVIDINLCTGCGDCTRICPRTQENKLHFAGKVYAALAKDDVLREDSSSGGIFSLSAEEILNAGGSVFGASLARDFSVHHIEILHAEELKKLRGSKYVQSEVSFSYHTAKSRLEDGKRVLFSGTPCQIAGLYAYLEKDYENLLTVDLLCHGVPSPTVFRKFLDAESDYTTGELAEVLFRKKIYGWKKNFLVLNFTDGQSRRISMNESFLAGFLKDLYLRECCYQCPYARMERTGDITLGDYWGYEESRPQYMEDDDRGISFVSLNTAKGETVFRAIRKKIVSAPRSMEDAVRGNPILVHSANKPAKSELFWQDFPKFSWNELCEKYFPLPESGEDFMPEEEQMYLSVPFTKRHRRHVLKRYVHLPLSVIQKLRITLKSACRRIRYKLQKTPHIRPALESIEYIRDTGHSVARFGDGEFTIIRGEGIGFQKYDSALAERLLEVLTVPVEGLEIGIPNVFDDLSGLKERGAVHWQHFLENNRTWILKKLDNDRIYCDAFMTRFWTAFHYDKERLDKTLELYWSIWNQRELVFVEGRLTRMGAGNDLFDNAASIQRILCPAENAWDKYDDILKEVRIIYESKPDALFILALGPAATVLAYDMAKMGMRALDLGHLDIQYEYYLRNEEEITAIEGKYVNENKDGHIVSDEIVDQAYLDSIIAVIE